MGDAPQQIVVYALVLGSFYLFISLGFSVTCGVLRIFNLGYGITFLVGVYGTWMLMREFHLGLVPAIVGVFLLQFAITLGVVYFPIVRNYLDREEMLLTSLLLIYLIVEEAINYRYPITEAVNLGTTIIPGSTTIGSSTIPNQMLVAAITGLVVTGLLVAFLLRSRIGLFIRAISQDLNAARMMGARVGRVHALAMILSVIPPTMAVLLIAPVWSLDPYMSWPLMQTSIMVAILGGLGNIRGSIIAAFTVGLVASTVSFLVNPRLSGLAILVMVFFVLIFRPEGISRSESLW